MKISKNEFYHIYNQGNNHETTFIDYEDYIYFLKLIRTFVHPYCKILCYCLMPNHFHFLVETDVSSAEEVRIGNIYSTQLQNGFRKALSLHASFFNKKYGRNGSLFRQKTKFKWVDSHSSKSLENCFYYIHQNPLTAGIVDDLKCWEYSSFKDYIQLRNGTLCDKLITQKYIDISVDRIIENSSILISEEFFSQS